MDPAAVILVATIALVVGLCIGLAINGLGYRAGKAVAHRREQRQARQDMATALALVTPAEVR